MSSTALTSFWVSQSGLRDLRRDVQTAFVAASLSRVRLQLKEFCTGSPVPPFCRLRKAGRRRPPRLRAEQAPPNAMGTTSDFHQSFQERGATLVPLCLSVGQAWSVGFGISKRIAPIACTPPTLYFLLPFGHTLRFRKDRQTSSPFLFLFQQLDEYSSTQPRDSDAAVSF